MNKNDNHEKRHYWLYVLKLEDDKYYVGITKDKDPQTRINQHKNGFYTAQWVKKYSYVETVDIFNIGYIDQEEASKLELAKTIELMKQYGLNNVRGGKLNYSGSYIKVGNRYFRDEDFKTMLAFMFLTFVIGVALFKLVITG